MARLIGTELIEKAEVRFCHSFIILQELRQEYQNMADILRDMEEIKENEINNAFSFE